MTDLSKTLEELCADKGMRMTEQRRVIARILQESDDHPDVEELYAARGWELPATIDRVYDSSKAERLLGFRCETNFPDVLAALRDGRSLPFDHDPAYVSPKEMA